MENVIEPSVNQSKRQSIVATAGIGVLAGLLAGFGFGRGFPVRPDSVPAPQAVLPLPLENRKEDAAATPLATKTAMVEAKAGEFVASNGTELKPVSVVPVAESANTMTNDFTIAQLAARISTATSIMDGDQTDGAPDRVQERETTKALLQKYRENLRLLSRD